MSNLKVIIWNVKQGVSIYAVAPNGKKVIIDCGSSDDFSPACDINPKHEKKKLDYLIISHPHQDHISDLLEIDKKFNVVVLSRNKKIDKKVMRNNNPDVFSPPNKTYIDKYYEYDERFTKKVEGDNSPSNTSWGNGCTFHVFYNDDNKNLEVNDLSVAVFIRFGKQTILYGGDLQEKGWKELLKQKEFCEFLSKTTILIASHHGNDSGYCAEIFEHFTPDIIIFSAGKYKDHAISKYKNHTQGRMCRKQNGEEENRYVLTTRNDGHIQMVIYSDATKPKITID